jgi:hypothetical protein
MTEATCDISVYGININLTFEICLYKSDNDMCTRYRYKITEQTVANGNVFVSYFEGVVLEPLRRQQLP